MMLLRKLVVGVVAANIPVVLIYYFTSGTREDYPFFLLLSIIFTVSTVILLSKDEFLKRLGLSDKEIIIKGVIWLVSPMMFLATILFSLSGWEIAKDAGHANTFLWGLISGIPLGAWGIYFYLKKPTSFTQFKFYRKTNTFVISLFLVISLLITAYFQDILPPSDWLVKTYPGVFAILSGITMTVLFFATLTSLLLAIVKKEHVEV